MYHSCVCVSDLKGSDKFLFACIEFYVEQQFVDPEREKLLFYTLIGKYLFVTDCERI